jgi:hypothetical protein
MRRRVMGIALLAVGGLLYRALPARSDDAPAQPLPLREVVIFSSGVGYFQRANRIEGSARVELSFRAEQVNDVLKSLVLFDSAGTVYPISYATDNPAVRETRGPGLSLGQNASLGALLRQFQGARVRLELARGPAVEGRIVSVSAKPVPAKEGPAVELEVLSVLSEGGLRSIPLEQVLQVKLLDERLDRQLRESLEALAARLDERRRTVALRFEGGGAREVRVGYLQEMPVWKTSYRLVLGKNEKPYLQGWAIVENTTEEDWKDVRLSLVAGRPVSFIQDLYQPLFVSRPVVPPQVVGSPIPQTYGEALETDRAGTTGLPGAGGGAPFGSGGGFAGASAGEITLEQVDGEPRFTLNLRGMPLRTAIERLFAGTAFQFAIAPEVPNTPITLHAANLGFKQALQALVRAAAGSLPNLTFSNEGGIYVIKMRQPGPPPPQQPETPAEGVDTLAQGLARSVSAQARGAGVGELFMYAIQQPITLARGKAAMVPIVSQSVEGERLSIYDAASDAEHALNGFRLKNNTGLHLSGGPITVFQDGVYAGDAQIGHLGPGEERLISYAVDLDLVAGHQDPDPRQETLSITAKNGVLLISRRQQQERVYTFRNKSEQPKTVLVQQAIDPQFKLVQPPKPAEQTPEEYRFLVPVPAQKTAELKVVTERPVTETVALLNADVDVLLAYARHARVSPKLQAALKQLAEQRQQISGLQTARAALEDELKTIDQEQSRIRQNMAQLDRNSPLYQQYVTKLTEQEARIERARGEIRRLREAEAAAQKQMSEFVKKLSPE